MDKLECIAVSLVVTVIANKILAVHAFKVIDGYVKDLLEMAKKSIRDAVHAKGDTDIWIQER